MHLVLQMAAFALSQRLILTIIIESFSIDQGGVDNVGYPFSH